MSRLPQTLLRQGLVACASSSLFHAYDRTAGATTGDPNSGAQQFQARVACHSLVPGRNRTGSSPASVGGRKAVTAGGFQRYPPALTDPGVVWDERSLDTRIADSDAFPPSPRMGFRGLPDRQARADLVACLVQIGPGGAAPTATTSSPPTAPSRRSGRPTCAPRPTAATAVIVGAGMMGDRTSAVFAIPGEISLYITPGC